MLTADTRRGPQKESTGMIGLARKTLLRILLRYGADGAWPAEGVPSACFTQELLAAGLGISEGEVQAELRYLAQQGVLQVDYRRGAGVQVLTTEQAALNRLLGHTGVLTPGPAPRPPADNRFVASAPAAGALTMHGFRAGSRW